MSMFDGLFLSQQVDRRGGKMSEKLKENGVMKEFVVLIVVQQEI